MLSLALLSTVHAGGTFEAGMEQSFGVLSGESIREERGPASWTDISLRPERRTGAWRLGLPWISPTARPWASPWASRS